MSPEQNVSGEIPWSPVPAPETFETMLTPHLTLLRRWVGGRVQTSEDADDVIQQTLLLGFRHIEQFRHEASFGTWLCSIATNVIRGRHRRPDSSRMVFVDRKTLENLNLKDPRQTPLANLENKEGHNALYQAISKLPVIYREVVELRDFQCLSIHETARSLRITKAALKSRHHRARFQLLKLMTEDKVARSLFSSKPVN